MKSPNKQTHNKSIELMIPCGLALALLGVITLLGILVYRDYGNSTDELVEINMVIWHVENFHAGLPWSAIPGNMEYYGLFFNVISIIPYLLINIYQHPGNGIVQILTDSLKSGDIYTAKHLATFLFSLIGYAGVILITKNLLNCVYAAAALLILAMFPEYWGHSFFNPKDIPFAAMFTFASYIGVLFSTRMISTLSDTGRQKSNLYILSLVLGGLVGLLTCIRVGGFVVLGFALIVQYILWLFHKPPLRGNYWSQWFIAILAMTIAWTSVTIILTPISWSAPHKWFFEAVEMMAKYQWDGVTLTFGHNWWGHDTPWYYLPVWFSITTPLLSLGLAATGWLALLNRFRNLSLLQQSIFIWLSLQALALPFVAILHSSTIYNGVRQFFFVLPAMAIFAAYGISTMLTKLPHWYLKAALLATFAFYYATVIAEMIRLHPYEYIYLNSMARVPNIDRQFETDYWALSVREAMEWVNRQPGEHKVVYYYAPPQSIAPFAESAIKLVPYDTKISEAALAKPFYYLAYPRNKFANPIHPQDYFANCKVVYKVTRQLGSTSITLSVVKLCR